MKGNVGHTVDLGQIHHFDFAVVCALTFLPFLNNRLCSFSNILLLPSLKIIVNYKYLWILDCWSGSIILASEINQENNCQINRLVKMIVT